MSREEANELDKISIHALHEESDRFHRRKDRVGQISIHALHEESDQAHHGHAQGPRVISIHALHEESDRGVRPVYHPGSDFNPRSP